MRIKIEYKLIQEGYRGSVPNRDMVRFGYFSVVEATEVNSGCKAKSEKLETPLSLESLKILKENAKMRLLTKLRANIENNKEKEKIQQILATEEFELEV